MWRKRKDQDLEEPSSETSSVKRRSESEKIALWIGEGLLGLSILGITAALGWIYGFQAYRGGHEARLERLAERDIQLSTHNDRLVLSTERAQATASEAAAEARRHREENRLLAVKLRQFEDRIANQEKAAASMRATYEEGWGRTKERLEETESEFRVYRERYKLQVREAARGKELGNFRYRDTVFRSAVIETVTAAGIEIRHEAGAARMLFPLLPEFLRVRYAYEPGESAEYLADERQRWLRTQIIADNERIAERERVADIERRIAAEQIEEQAEEVLAQLRTAEASLAFCRKKIRNPGNRSPKDYEWKIRRLERDIQHYERQLKGLR